MLKGSGRQIPIVHPDPASLQDEGLGTVFQGPKKCIIDNMIVN
jgi:hypothetical protein